MKRPTKPIEYPALLLFGEIDGEGEYVVIATEGPIEDHCLDGYEFKESEELLADMTMWPTDAPLWKRR